MSEELRDRLDRGPSRRAGHARASAAPPPTWVIAPVPRIALTQQEACAALGCSDEFFVEHIRPHMRVIRRGRKRLFPVDELRRAVDEMAEDVM
jgi:excisionase family DNA binding protein